MQTRFSTEIIRFLDMRNLRETARPQAGERSGEPQVSLFS